MYLLCVFRVRMMCRTPTCSLQINYLNNEPPLTSTALCHDLCIFNRYLDSPCADKASPPLPNHIRASVKWQDEVELSYWTAEKLRKVHHVWIKSACKWSCRSNQVDDSVLFLCTHFAAADLKYDNVQRKQGNVCFAKKEMCSTRENCETSWKRI